jgi:hypothetical protein
MSLFGNDHDAFQPPFLRTDSPGSQYRFAKGTRSPNTKRSSPRAAPHGNRANGSVSTARAPAPSSGCPTRRKKRQRTSTQKMRWKNLAPHSCMPLPTYTGKRWTTRAITMSSTISSSSPAHTPHGCAKPSRPKIMPRFFGSTVRQGCSIDRSKRSSHGGFVVRSTRPGRRCNVQGSGFSFSARRLQLLSPPGRTAHTGRPSESTLVHYWSTLYYSAAARGSGLESCAAVFGFSRFPGVCARCDVSRFPSTARSASFRGKSQRTMKPMTVRSEPERPIRRAFCVIITAAMETRRVMVNRTRRNQRMRQS